MELAIIVAAAENHVIGRDNGIDLAFIGRFEAI